MIMQENANTIFALVDCNNFYVSCERLFNPQLKNKPVVVLSNNDGCVISRSKEAKELGIPMGAPYFKFKQLINDNNVAVFSSNYQLYGDVSNRIMESFRSLVPDMEVYSIDEAFLRLDKIKNIVDVYEYAKFICQTIEQWVGISLSVGIGPTKTLAKLANHIAKKNRDNKVFDLRNIEVQDNILSKFPVKEIWGVGRKGEKKLHSLGITTALELRQSNSKMIRSKFSVVGERMVMELRGISCLSIETMQPRKNIMSSKSFGRLTNDINELEEAVANYVAKGAVKLRGQKSQTAGIVVFVRTNRFSKTEVPYGGSTVINFAVPTNDTRKLIAAAKEGLHKIYKPEYKYQKAGILLLDLIPEESSQQNFFSNKEYEEKNKILMETMDRVNRIEGKETLFIASQGIKRAWQMKAEMRSNRFTTKWHELCLVS